MEGWRVPRDRGAGCPAPEPLGVSRPVRYGSSVNSARACSLEELSARRAPAASLFPPSPVAALRRRSSAGLGPCSVRLLCVDVAIVDAVPHQPNVALDLRRWQAHAYMACMKVRRHGGSTESELASMAVSVSVVFVVHGQPNQLEESLSTAAALLSALVADYELIVVAAGLDAEGTSLLQRLSGENVQPRLRVYVLTKEVDSRTASWFGIENALSDFVAIVDPSADDIGFLPQMLRRAVDGADIVFARKKDGAPSRLPRAATSRLIDGLYRSLHLTPAGHSAPRYRIISRRVVCFVQQHPDPISTYRRLPWGSNFARVNLEYSTTTPARPWRDVAGSVERRLRLLLWTALEKKMLRRGAEATFYDNAVSDEAVYLLKLPVIKAGTFRIAGKFLEKGTGRYHAANPTIARLDDRTWVNVRLVNYEKRGHGAVISGDGVIRTRNLTLEWCARTGLAESVHEAAGVPDSWPQATGIRGLEDQRWLVHQGRMWFSACCAQVPYAAGRCSMVLGRMNKALDAVEHLVPLHYVAAREAEKNWLLWSAGGQLLVIYGYHPFTVLSVDPESGQTRVFRQLRSEFHARRYRGSAGPIAIPERPGHWLVLVHEVALRFEGPVYAHRWIEVQPDVGIVAYSRPFVFDHIGIEYAAGLIDTEDGNLVVTYGFEDREARWVVLDRARVLASLRAAWTDPSARQGTASWVDAAAASTVLGTWASVREPLLSEPVLTQVKDLSR